LEPAVDRGETSRESSTPELECHRGIQTTDSVKEPVPWITGSPREAPGGLLERKPTFCSRKRRCIARAAIGLAEFF
jgi:hypothetical protein